MIQCTLTLVDIKLPVNKKIKSAEFEKDNPTNYHIDLISAIANLRARNYKVQNHII